MPVSDHAQLPASTQPILCAKASGLTTDHLMMSLDILVEARTASSVEEHETFEMSKQRPVLEPGALLRTRSVATPPGMICDDLSGGVRTSGERMNGLRGLNAGVRRRGKQPSDGQCDRPESSRRARSPIPPASPLPPRTTASDAVGSPRGVMTVIDQADVHRRERHEVCSPIGVPTQLRKSRH